MLNDPMVPPAGMVTLETVGAATVGLLLASETTTPPAGAAHSSAIVPFTVDPPVAGLGDSATVLARMGRTVTSSVCDSPPKLAVNLPATGVVTFFVVIVKVTDELPCGTVTLAGAVAAPLVLDNGTTAPPSGAAPVSAILPADVPQP